jgi:aminopeptidase N
MKTLIFFVLLFLAMTTAIFSQQPPIEPGVPKALAEWRAKHYSDIRYKLNLTLEKGAPLMKGEIEISVTLDEEGAKYPLVLDWRTTQFQNDKDKPFAEVVDVNEAFDFTVIQTSNEHISILDGIKNGENVIKIQFASPIKTSGSAITRYIDKEDGSEYIYSLFVPSDASTAFPVFDQPDLKARFSLSLYHPKEWKAISNTEGKSWIENATGRKGTTTSFVTEFQETKPISTYVFAFAAGDFVEVVEHPNLGFGKGNSIFVRKSQNTKFDVHAKEVFRLNRECVKYLEEYFDYKFPFPKYDLVLIPEFPFGGMEHAGATFLRESSIIFPSEPTKNDLISRATLIFHEAAHQWFGDTVTMKWFDDLWLKEGFATFAGFKALDKIMPEMNAWKAFYERNKVAAYQTDSTKGTTPIYQEIPNLSAAKSAYGAIVYSKAPSFLKQAEFYLGEKEFQTAVRSFLKKYEFKNATWQDLVTEFALVSKKDLGIWAKTWVKERGLSVINYEDNWATNEKGKEYLFSQYDKFKDAYDVLGENDEINFLRQVSFNALVKFKNGETRVVKIVTTKEDILMSLKLPSDVDYIFPNYQDYGYGIFLLDEKSRNYILANVHNEKDDFLRAMMYGSLWDSVREAELNPQEYVELVIKNVATEKDETIVASMLGRANTALNYYIESEPLAVASGSTRQTQNSKNNSDAKLQPSATADGSDKAELIRKLEDVLINKMQSAETLGQRITFYRSFLNVVSSENGREVLKQILNSKFQIPDFKLKTKDKFDIVTKLFILGDKDAENLLAELTKTETSDDAKRYAYAARAGISTAENKAKYWNDFINNQEISESWIEAAFVPFNSIRHSNLTQIYLEKSLAELPNHKRNRKIFFVNGWLGAFIGGQKDEKALGTVNKFLADNPNLDKDLRLKILENVDVIERAVKIRARF